MQEKHVQLFVQLVFFVILHRLITKFINYDMKKSKILMAFIAVVLFMAPQESSAQSLLQKLGGAVSSLTSSGGSSSSTSGNLVQTVANLLGTIALQSDSLQGTWVYSQPCVAFESENVLTSLGGVAASAKVESTLKSLLQKAGFTEGKVTLTFNADKLMTTLKAVSNATSKLSTTAAIVNSLLSSYNGMRIGFELKK